MSNSYIYVIVSGPISMTVLENSWLQVVLKSAIFVNILILKNYLRILMSKGLDSISMWSVFKVTMFDVYCTQDFKVILSSEQLIAGSREKGFFHLRNTRACVCVCVRARVCVWGGARPPTHPGWV